MDRMKAHRDTMLDHNNTSGGPPGGHALSCAAWTVTRGGGDSLETKEVKTLWSRTADQGSCLHDPGQLESPPDLSPKDTGLHARAVGPFAVEAACLGDMWHL